MTSRSVLSLGALAFLLFTGCDGSPDTAGTRYGPAAAVGGGTVRTFVQTDAAGAPVALGVVLSESALSGLPAHAGGDGHESLWTLRFPDEARAAGLQYDHVWFGWNPEGHEPEGLFTYPHFDLHFYWVPVAERESWTPADPRFAEKGERAPEAKYVPEGYALPPGPAVPEMGNHLVDTADPTYAPGGPVFTEVLIWGSYDGRVPFLEPMITKAFFESLKASGRAHVETLAQPQAFQTAGYYPTRYSIRYDAAEKAYLVTLDGLVRHAAG